MLAGGRRLFAPEVIQTSAMDCGPASLKSMLEGWGVPVSYGRLREACQTDVDGTSIDVIEDVANQLGLEAEQILVPLDHVFLPETGALPAIAVWRNPDGAPHFVILWRVVGSRVMVMDPGMGRRWIDREEVLKNLFHHGMPLPADAWREWAGSDEFAGSLKRRLHAIGAWSTAKSALDAAAADPGWRAFASLDAAIRLTTALVKSGGVQPGRAAGRLVVSLMEAGLADQEAIPPAYWSARISKNPSPDQELVFARGGVLVRVRGVSGRAEDQPPLPPELEAALKEPPARPIRELVSMLREDGVLTPAALFFALLAASIGGAVEALLMRGLLDVGRHLGLFEQRAGALALFFALLVALLMIDLPVAASSLRMGRKLETRMRVAFLSKIPRLADRYFQSRPTSDMAHRCHAIHPIRSLPQMATRLLRSSMDLLVACTGLVWIDPHGLPLVLSVAGLSIAVPWASQRIMVERDLRVRSYDGAVTRFYLDALLGLFAIRTHGAERALRSEHSQMLGDWMRANHDRLRASIFVEGAEQIVGSILAIWLAFDYLTRISEPAAVLLLLYWALAVPGYGQEIAASARTYPSVRNLLLRLIEPLGAIEESEEMGADEQFDEETGTFRINTNARGVDLAFRNVAIRAAGRTILEGVDLNVRAGEHVAVVGPSGAGKSSFVGLLLGWHRPSEGAVYVDGRPLRGERLRGFRTETAWIDPAVQLWNRSLLENLTYGSIGEPQLAQVLEDADLVALLERLPNGLQTELGEGGALVSGGEGQRVRFGRAMMRPASRLVILDEPFRGLDREKRGLLLSRARRMWKGATMVCVTHDVGETLEFDRVLVIEDGRVVEGGRPASLAGRPQSRYRQMLDAEEDVRSRMWRGAEWRRLVMRGGILVDEIPVHEANPVDSEEEAEPPTERTP